MSTSRLSTVDLIRKVAKAHGWTYGMTTSEGVLINHPNGNYARLQFTAQGAVSRVDFSVKTHNRKDGTCAFKTTMIGPGDHSKRERVIDWLMSHDYSPPRATNRRLP